MATVIQVKRGTAAAWTSANTVLTAGEIGFESDTKKMKVGDGSTAWTSLAYTATDGDITAVVAGTGLSGGSTSGSATLAIDTSVVVDKTTAQTLTNKTLTSPVLTTPSISTMTTTGDILYASSANTPARLGIGSTGNVLTVASGVPSWAAPASSSGMTLVSSTSFSGVSSHSVNNCFSSTYENYRIVLTTTAFSGTNNAQVRMRLRASGTDNTANYYTANNYYAYGTTADVSYANNNGFLAGYAMNHPSEADSISVIDIMQPFVTGFTPMTGYGQAFFSNLGNSYALRFSGLLFSATSCDGFTLIPASDTMTGKVRVYGYSN